MLPELVQQLGCTSCNVRIMAIAIVFVELQYILPTDSGTLVDTEFANARKLTQLDNRKDVQRWIKTLYTQSDKNVTLLAYHKIDTAILWFVNTI